MIKKGIRFLINKLGYNITRVKYNRPGLLPKNNAFDDIRRLLGNNTTPVIFDVGANIGQTINHFLNYFPASEIYSFEPGHKTFSDLKSSFQNRESIHLENVAIGSETGKKHFFENQFPDMSSFLEIDRQGWGTVNDKVLVDVTTIDHYCKLNNIKTIDVLKSDTQGFELEVFKGAMKLMRANNIQLVYFEFVFSKMYKGLPSFDEVYKLLSDNNFRLVNLYDFHMQEGMLSWADLLFVNENYKSPNHPAVSSS